MRRLIPRVLAFLALGVSVLSPGPAQAATCSLSGANGTYQVARLVAPGGPAGISWRQRDPIAYPFVDDKTFVANLAVFVFQGGGSPDLYVVDYVSSASPHVVVQGSGQAFTSSFPTTNASGIHGGQRGYSTGALGGGTYYVVAFGYGASEGALGQGIWSVNLFAGADCTPVDAPGELLNFTQADFHPSTVKGAAQVYAPGVGAGGGLVMTKEIKRSNVLGAVYAYCKCVNAGGSLGVVGGKVDLRYHTPSGDGRTGTAAPHSIDAMYSLGGTFNFNLDYYGVDPLADINVLAVDLP